MPAEHVSFSDLVNLEVPDAGAQGCRRHAGTPDCAADVPVDEAAGCERFVRSTRRSLAGIALSGGGIRSATFSLGLLQGLASLGLLRGFDYLATVSGGGYVGGFWTRWRSRQPPGDAARADFPERRDGLPCDDLRHLRQFGNFLTPRLGVFSVDTGRAVVAVLSGTLPALLAALSLVALTLGAWLLAAWLLLGRGFDWWGRPAESAASLAALGIGTAAALVAGEWAWRRRGLGGDWGVYIAAVLLGTGATVGAFGLLGIFWAPLYARYPVSPWLPVLADGQPVSDWLALAAPAAAWLGGAALLLVVRFFRSTTTRTLRRREVRDAYDRAQARLLLFAGLWCVAVLLWILGAAAAYRTGLPGVENLGRGLAGTSAAAAAAFAFVRKRVKDTGPLASGARIVARLGPLLPQLLAYTAVGAAAALVAALYVRVGIPLRLDGTLAEPAAPAVLALLPAGALALTLAVLFFMDPDEVGLHAFYRARLVRAYLGASNGAARFRSEEHAHDDVRLDHPDLGSARSPLHLVCCAANDLGIDRLFENLQRGAVSAVLSPVAFSVGPSWAPWGKEGEVPTLGAAMTASGAAFNSLMGARTIQYGPAVTFLAAALNLRLGIWLPHPRAMRRPPLGRLFFPARVVRGQERRAWLGALLRRLAPALRGRRFYREMLGWARADGRGPVHLSDGGHFENTGVYELIRRHCTFILAADCGQDGDVAFDDLGNLVRKAREDFGVDVRIDLSRLRPDDDRRAKQHVVAGEIHYPDGETGILLVFKPALVGSEPPDVQQYAARNADFPHEGTGDQFYDEAQWEAYRRLGEHAAKVAFGRLAAGLPGDSRRALAEAFGRARFEWLPAPAGMEDRAARLGERMNGLDALLRREHCRPLLAEVWGELPDATRASLAAPPADAPPGWGDEALLASLEAVRTALRTAEDVFRAEGLERNGSHPAYLGVINYLARWAQAPTVRAWWPVLRPLHGAAFARFMEREFDLPTECRRSCLGEGGDGFASRAWRLRAPVREDAGARVVSYEIAIGEGAGAGRLQAGRLLCHASPRVVAWRAEDFFIPPGLWGCGFGSDFLRLLADGGAAPFLGGEGGVLLAQVPSAPDANSEARRRAANEVQLYRNAGFAEAVAERGMLVVSASSGVRELDMRDLPPSVIRHGTRWMVAARFPAPAGAAAPAPEPAGAGEG